MREDLRRKALDAHRQAEQTEDATAREIARLRAAVYETGYVLATHFRYQGERHISPTRDVDEDEDGNPMRVTKVVYANNLLDESGSLEEFPWPPGGDNDT